MMSKRHYGKRIREEEEATAHVFQDFLTSFQDIQNAPPKVFIKSGIINSNKTTDTSELSDGQIYRPKPVIASTNVSLKTALECAKILKEPDISKSKRREKPRSNLEMLKEEIKQRQLQKDESTHSIHQTENNDPTSTNLFIANLNPKITEDQLLLIFGKFGALASVKIMWPRGEEKFRNFSNTNCGFIAFMSRKDAERALISLGSRDDMRLSWGKCVEIPPHPIYVPPKLIKLFLPPPSSGLPFNAQPTSVPFEFPRDYEELDMLLSSAVVKVTIPLDKRILCIIHRMVEFVVREGPLFEALVMMTEANNPDFSFLNDYRSSLHSYYRWKLFSILNGDGQRLWSLKPFRMVKNGPVWIPPSPIDYTAGMPDHLLEDDVKGTRDLLSDAQCARLMDLIRNLNSSRNKIRSAMSFCVNHIEAIDDTLTILFDSLKQPSTSPVKKVARLYLLSDIFCCIKRSKDSKMIKKEFINDVQQIFESLYAAYLPLKKIDKDNLKSRILAVLRSWNTYRVFPSNFLEKLESFFIETVDDEDDISDEPLDGANLLKRNSAINQEVKIVSQIMEKSHFIQSCWNAVDPEELESQAMSTQKLFELEMNHSEKKNEKRRKRKKKGYALTVSSKWDSDDDFC